MTHLLAPAIRTEDLSSWLEIDGAAFQSNIREVQTLVQNRAGVCAVIKSDAYGHGADLLMPALVDSGVPYIGVGSNREAGIARSHGYTGKLLRVRAAAPPGDSSSAGIRH
ncbi:alanine racemase [Paenarthrobacter sp. S56]|uniref:alanine racemase n=1 Tax=Paenarthrobacter sp. S56 TaxID=3138179 RepID=UPI00321AC9B4